LPSGFLIKTLYVFIFSLKCSTNLIFLNINILITLDEKYKLWKLLICNFLQLHVTVIEVQIFYWALCPETPPSL
jgi:hypothetical protein